MKEVSSRALQVNIEEFRVEVTIDPKYRVIQELMSGYEGLQKPLNSFLEELCHPRKNWQYIVEKARTFSLGYFHDLKTREQGPDAVKLYVDIALEAIKSAPGAENKSGAFSNLYLLLQKFIKEGGSEGEKFLPPIQHAFREIRDLPENLFSVVAKSYYRLPRLAGAYLEMVPRQEDIGALNDMLIRYYQYTFSSWLSVRDPIEWFKQEIAGPLPFEPVPLFSPLSHQRFRELQTELKALISNKEEAPRETAGALLKLPGYGDIVDEYRGMPEKLSGSAENEKLSRQYKLVFLFHILSIPGLSSIHEETLREINRDISWMIEHEDMEHIQELIEKTFPLLSRSIDRFPDTVLKSVLNIGKGVYETDKSDLVHFFNEHAVRLGFQTPDFTGISDDWQIQSNLAHIENIRIWMELIGLNPKWSKKLLSSLIVHLALCGVLIKDTDLFPRDITKFLNSDVRPVYNLVKQLMRLFPTYFNEIGAEGALRDISTEIDELCGRKDVLVHFLRKQSHVESSNRTISLIEAMLEFWRTKRKEGLKSYLPANIYDQIHTEGPYIDGVHRVIKDIFRARGLNGTSDLLSLDKDSLQWSDESLPDDERRDRERVSLALSFYKLLDRKYCVSSCDIGDSLSRAGSTIPQQVTRLRKALSGRDSVQKLSSLLAVLEELKNLILSPERYEVREDIYRKRHIAADIPSLYGSYHEIKFDALGLTFRIESVVNTLFEELIEEFDLRFITHHTFYQIYKYLGLFSQALSIDGIPTREFENQLELFRKALNIKLVTFGQYLDVFRGFTRVVRNIVSDYFNNIHHENLKGIVEHLPSDKLQPKYLRQSGDREELFHRVSEIFLRDTIASSLAIQRLDLFLTRISNTLHEQAEKLPLEKHYLLLTYDPRNIVASVSEPHSRLLDIVQLGNKGLNMVKMNQLGLPVPPGFIVTTEVYRCRELIESYRPANEHFRKQISRKMSSLEKLTGKMFGSPDNALLVSVRSGAAISQPGMMDSYLNVGINEDVVNGMIRQTGEAWFCWDCYRRFLQSFGMSFGLLRDEFDAIIDDFKKKHGALLKKDLTPEQMKQVALSYREYVRAKGLDVTESPEEQLYTAIQRVLNSWNSPKARAYRKIIGISDDWGTAVTVQTMVFGNLSARSGSGVFFTHSPRFSPDLLRPWGDYSPGNQGEDVVSGLVTTYPISDFQAKLENRPAENALENKFPEIYRGLRETAKAMIYDNQWAPQDIEFTFEGPRIEDLHILQTRDMEMREVKEVPSFESTAAMAEQFLGHGIGVSGGALSGRVVFSLEDIAKWRKTEPETPLILVRNDTVPDDIREISAADGLLTARGGATSHAAIVANRLEKTCVAGCRDLVCREKDRKFILKGTAVHEGQYISIDGSEGSVYLGKMEVSRKAL